MHAKLSLQQLTPRLIENGDAGIILKADGTFQLFNVNDSFDPENMTDRQRQQGEQLFALSIALNIPAVMQILVQMANDPNVTGPDPVDFGTAH